MRIIHQFKNDHFRKINWMLLLFLVLFMNVKMPVKVAAVLFMLVLNRKMFFEKWIYRQKFIWFYFSMIIIAIMNFVISITSVTIPYLLVVSTGIFFWLLCISGAFLNSWFVAKTDTAKLHTTIKLFFILNAIVTLVQLFLIILDAGSVNPYIYQGMHQKYFMGTGDFMTGITFDVCTTNAIINAFGVVYFLKRSKMGLALLCMVILLLTASNFMNVLLALVLSFLFVFQSNRSQKSVIVVCFFLLIIFLVKISPQNDNYIIYAYNKLLNKKTEQKLTVQPATRLTDRPDSILSTEEKKQKTAILWLDSLAAAKKESIRKEDSLENREHKLPIQTEVSTKPFIPKPGIHTEPFQRRRDTSAFQKELMGFAEKKIATFDSSLKQTRSQKLPGKLIAFRETLSFLKKHPLKFITGCGTGNFSSKLAFRATGLQIAGSYPKKMSYINTDFLDNHLRLYLNYFSQDIELHSLVNTPNSVYDQLIAEYGIPGVLAFILLYLAFFTKHIRKLTYGLPLLLILLGSFGVDYWYEQLSIAILFELLMLLNIKETKEKNE